MARSGIKNVWLGKSPERDREIDGICQMIRNTSRAGIPSAKYNLTILAVVRTEPTPGRGGASYSTFDYAKAKEDPPLTEAGPVSEDAHWERITYFLNRVAPVAAEYKVKIACHPHDPGMPAGKAFRGVHRVMGSVEGLKRFVGISENPYHGLNFCQGTVAEMLDKPGEEIYDVIRYFGSRGKIFNVHFRNIKGRFLEVQEAALDAAEVDVEDLSPAAEVPNHVVDFFPRFVEHLGDRPLAEVEAVVRAGGDLDEPLEPLDAPQHTVHAAEWFPLRHPRIVGMAAEPDLAGFRDRYHAFEKV